MTEHAQFLYVFAMDAVSQPGHELSYVTPTALPPTLYPQAQ